MPSKKGNRSKSRNPANSTHQLVQADKKEGQQYAVVTKPLGNCTFLVEKQNGDDQACSLKGSMKGKKFERVNIGDLVLTQLDPSTTSKNKFYIIHLYNPKEKKQLEKLGEFVSATEVDDTCVSFIFEGDEKIIQNKQSDVDIESLINDL